MLNMSKKYCRTPLGKMIKKYRLENKLGLRQAAKILDISAPYLCRLDTGDEPHAPSERIIWKMAYIYKVEPQILFIAANKIPVEMKYYIIKNEEIFKGLFINSLILKQIYEGEQ